MILDKIKDKGENMSVLEGMERLQYIIDEAKSVEPLEDEHKTEENKSKGWKNTFKNLHSSLVKGTILSSEYTPVNIKIKKNPMLPRSSKCDNCTIC